MYSTSRRRPRQRFAYHLDYGHIGVMQRRPPVNVIRQKFFDDSWKLNLSGFSYIFKKKLSVWERIVWFLACLAALTICLYQISDRIAAYMEEPVVTKTYFITNKTISFPAITVCPGQFEIGSYQLMRRFRVPFTAIDELLENGTITVYDIWNQSRIDSIEKISVTFRDGSNDDSDFFHTSEADTPLGGCVTLTPKQELDFQVSQISVKLDLNSKKPIKIMLHNPGRLLDAQYHTLHKSKFLFQPTVYEDIIHVMQVIKCNTKREPCTDERTVRKCLAFCIERKVRSYTPHNCSLPFMSTNEDRPCSSLKEISDTLNVVLEITSKIHLPDCGCPNVCSEITFKVENERLGGTYLRTHIFVATIFENVILVIQDERSYTWLFLCCDIGGTIGLWLGICLLEVLEEIVNITSKLLPWITTKHPKTSFAPKQRRPEIQIIRGQSKEESSSDDLGIPGFQDFVNRKLPLRTRLLWLVIAIISLCFTVYQCVLLIERYIEDPFLTTIYYEDNNTGAYPLVTLCPDTNEDFLPVINPSKYNLEFKGMLTSKSILNKLAAGNITVDNLWNLSGFHVEDTKYELTGIKENATYTNTAKFVEVTTKLGTCISVVPEKYFLPKLKGTEMKIKISGPNTKISYIRVILHDAEDSVMLPYLLTRNNYKFPMSLRIPIIYFAFSKVMKMAEVLDLYFWSQLNRVENLNKVIHRNTYKNPCSSRLIVAKCKLRCIERKIFSKVMKPCRLRFMKNSVKFPPCLNYNDFMIMNNSTLVTLSGFKFEDCNCPVNCEEIILQITGYGARKWNKIGAELTIFQDRHIVIEEHNAYTFSALISDMGSALGMLFGFFAIQLIEILLHLTLKFISLQKKHFWPKKLPISPQQRELADIRPGRTIVFTSHGNKPTEERTEIKIPGFEHVLNKTSSKCVRSVWLTISIAAICMCVFQCAESIAYYLTDPSDVISYYQFNQSLFYPIVTIGKCYEIREEYGKLSTNDSFPDLWSTEIRSRVTAISNVLLTKTEEQKMVKEKNTFMGSALSVLVDKPDLHSSFYNNLTVQVYVKRSSQEYYYCAAAQISADDSLLIPYDIPYYLSRRPSRLMVYKRKNFNSYGTELKMHLQVAEINYRNTQLNPCSDGETVANCLVDCLETRIYQRAKTICRLPFMKPSQVIPECKTNEEFFRIQNATLIEVKNIDFEAPELCSCPRKCKIHWYTIKKEVSQEMVGKTLGVVTVSIPDNNIFVTREEKAYPFLKLLSDIGGTIGFYIGFGSLQMFEILVTLFKPYLRKAICRQK